MLVSDESEVHILEMAWQIIRIIALARSNLNATPLLAKVLTGKETDEELAKLTNEAFLIKWMNYHLSKSKYGKTVSNFATDLRDGLALLFLLNQLDSACDLKATELQIKSNASKQFCSIHMI